MRDEVAIGRPKYISTSTREEFRYPDDNCEAVTTVDRNATIATKHIINNGKAAVIGEST